MEFFSIVFFLIVLYGFGSFISFIVRESEDFFEKTLMRFGIGLGIMLFFGFLLNLVRVPLDWRIFISAAILILIARCYIDYKKKELFSIKFKFNFYSILMLVLFFITLYMYLAGAFAYPYLEDDDPWSHAVGAKFVSVEKTVFAGKNGVFHYIDPYPPAYDMLMGIIHQTNDSVYWTIKFFNALIVSFCIIFFYYFAKLFTKSSKKAFYSAFALFAVPAFLSHFIWAIALTMPLFFVSFYCAEKINDDKRWWIITALVVMPTVTSSPTHSTYFGLFFIIYFIARTIVEKRFILYEFLAGFIGIALSFALWWIPTILTHSFKRVVEIMGPRAGTGILNVAGTGDRVYTLADFLCYPPGHQPMDCVNGQNAINNPFGIGIILSLIAIVGLIYLIFRYKEMLKKENYHKIIIVFWFLFSFYAVNAAKFPIKLSPFRAWMLLAIPVSMLAGEAINLIAGAVKSLSADVARLNKITTTAIVLAVLGVLFYGIIMTSFIPKYKVNTSPGWSIGGFWTSTEEIQGYIWFKDRIPAQSKVFTFSNNGVIIGFDKFICHWCPEVRDFQQNGINKNADEIYSKLKNDDYQYLVIDGQAEKKFGQNKTNNLLQGLGSLGLQPIAKNNGFIIFRI